jgi:hypothetical protein
MSGRQRWSARASDAAGSVHARPRQVESHAPTSLSMTFTPGLSMTSAQAASAQSVLTPQCLAGLRSMTTNAAPVQPKAASVQSLFASAPKFAVSSRTLFASPPVTVPQTLLFGARTLSAEALGTSFSGTRRAMRGHRPQCYLQYRITCATIDLFCPKHSMCSRASIGNGHG